MYVVRRGTWTLGSPPGYGNQGVPAGQFLVRHLGRLTAFETTADLTAKFLVLPPDELKPLLGNRAISGPADSAEMRLLTALTDMIHLTVADLGPGGVVAAQNTLIELTKAVAKGRSTTWNPGSLPPSPRRPRTSRTVGSPIPNFLRRCLHVNSTSPSVRCTGRSPRWVSR